MAKFSISMKDPDHNISTPVTPSMQVLLDKYLEWGEYITVEFDTVTKTARVVPVKENK